MGQTYVIKGEENVARRGVWVGRIELNTGYWFSKKRERAVGILIREIGAVIALTVFMQTVTASPLPSAKITISKRDCLKLVRYEPHDDVSFKPGVNVRGKKVRSANLGGERGIKITDEFSFKFNLNIAKKYGWDSKNISADIAVGKVTVRGVNVYFNGQRLTSMEQKAITAQCRKILQGS